MAQPIIRGIQAVGAVTIKYKYNGNGGKLVLPTNVMSLGGDTTDDANTIDTSGGVEVAGFRLDGEFLRATQQIASSVQIPILGGGAVALTNNNRSGTLTINATKVSTPLPDSSVLSSDTTLKDVIRTGGGTGQMSRTASLGPLTDNVYDLVFLAQAQQAQKGGDSQGATIEVCFAFCGANTIVSFEGCTIASVDPIGLSGNDAVNYNVQINYLNWTCTYTTSAETNSLTTIGTAKDTD